MKYAALVGYTSMECHSGKNEEEILSKFMQYASMCSDPMSVFRYMEGRSICVFQPAYWLTKADYFASCGDYANAFQCVEEATSRLGILEDPAQHMQPSVKFKTLYDMLVLEMQLAPRSKKRTIQQFKLLTEGQQHSTDHYKYLLTVYEEKYGEIKRTKESQFEKSREEKPISWMGEKLENNNQGETFIQCSSSRTSRIKDTINYSSLLTPIRSKDPMRLPKTRDSIEMLKKKKNTGDKSLIKEDNNPTLHSQQKSESVSINIKSLPVRPSAKTRSRLRKTVTFEADSNRIEKVRHCDTNYNAQYNSQISSKQDQICINNEKEETKMEIEFIGDRDEGKTTESKDREQRCQQKP